MTSILVSGGAGFIGSNFIMHLLNNSSDMKVINVDMLTYAGNLENLKHYEKYPNYTFIKADICDSATIEKVFMKYDISKVVNFAAESHVDRSIEDPELFLKTNIIGTQVLLETARKKWNVNPQSKYSKQYKEDVKFIQISTDEVYGSLGTDGLFSEEMKLMPSSPYSASKASADLLAQAYHKTYGLPINITRCSNNYGPYQFPEKLIPLIINNCLSNKKIPVYGNGMQVRDWLHVYDHCTAIEKVIRLGKNGEIYNIGGNNEKTNIDIVRIILKYFGKSDEWIEFVKDRPGHDKRYAINNKKITNELKWIPEVSFDKGIEETISWYVQNIEWVKKITSGDYEQYYKHMYNNTV